MLALALALELELELEQEQEQEQEGGRRVRFGVWAHQAGYCELHALVEEPVRFRHLAGRPAFLRRVRRALNARRHRELAAAVADLRQVDLRNELRAVAALQRRQHVLVLCKDRRLGQQTAGHRFRAMPIGRQSVRLGAGGRWQRGSSVRAWKVCNHLRRGYHPSCGQ